MMKRKYKAIIILVAAVPLLMGVATQYKLTEMPQLAQADNDDLIWIVDDANGTPVTYKIPRQEFLMTWTGSTNITTLGTIGTGTWNAGGVTTLETVEGATLTEGGVGVPNLNETDWVGTAELADEDWGDIAISGGAASVEAMTVNDAGSGTYYVGIFAADTGINQPIYTDGALSYTQATGTLAATEFSGGGGSLTGVDAATADSATAFFDAGTIEHEYGGLEADVSGYSGLVAIAGGATAEIDSLDELEGQLADVTRIVTEAVMPVAAADPDVDASGELSVDTDGANEPNDVTLRTSSVSGNQQYALAQVLKTIQVTLISPDTIDAADLIPIWANCTGMTFTITEWKAWSDDDNVSFELEEITDQSDFTAITTIDACEVATNGTGVYYASDTTITHATIEHDHLIAIDFDTDDTPDYLKVTITGWFNADVD